VKGSYFKMANLTVDYIFGDVAKVFKGTNIYVTAQNLFMISKYAGFDPEADSNASINNVPLLVLIILITLRREPSFLE
jgi:iron complex outermembrane receptor protein